MTSANHSSNSISESSNEEEQSSPQTKIERSHDFDEMLKTIAPFPKKLSPESKKED